MESLRDSVETSVTIKVFPSLEKATYHHIFHNEFTMLPLSKCRELQNFNPARLSKNPYPKDDRPRGQRDLDSVAHHRRIIRTQGCTEPIWVADVDGEHTLLDGAHRIVATYLEHKRTIPCYIVRSTSEPRR